MMTFKMPKIILLFLFCNRLLRNVYCGNSPEYIKLQQKTMRTQLARSHFKEQTMPAATSKLPKLGQITDNSPKVLEDSADFPKLEMFARQKDSGPWLRYEDRLANEVETNLIHLVCSGGTESDLSKIELGNYILDQLFPNGMNIDPIVHARVKSNIPILKKIKRREMQFGYRIPLADEVAITPIEFTSKRELQSLQSSTLSSILHLDEHGRIQIKTHPEDKFNEIKAKIPSILSDYISSLKLCLQATNCKDVVIFTDGSAVVSGKGTRCTTATAGLVTAPCRADGTILLDHSIGLYVPDVASMAITPFDAELLAGLAAVAVASSLSASEDKNGLSDAIATVRLVTDSRTLKKSLLATVEPDKEIQTSAADNDLINANSAAAASPEGEEDPNRRILSKLAVDLFKSLKERNTEVISIEWIRGHPERREEDSSKWSSQDTGIWLADQIATRHRRTAPSGKTIEDCVPFQFRPTTLSDLFITVNTPVVTVPVSAVLELCASIRIRSQAHAKGL